MKPPTDSPPLAVTPSAWSLTALLLIAGQSLAGFGLKLLSQVGVLQLSFTLREATVLSPAPAILLLLLPGLTGSPRFAVPCAWLALCVPAALALAFALTSRYLAAGVAAADVGLVALVAHSLLRARASQP